MAVCAALSWLQQHLLVRLEQRMAIAGAARFLEHVLRLPVDFFSHRYPGDIAQRLESVEMLSDLLAARIAPAEIAWAMRITSGPLPVSARSR